MWDVVMCFVEQKARLCVEYFGRHYTCTYVVCSEYLNVKPHEELNQERV